MHGTTHTAGLKKLGVGRSGSAATQAAPLAVAGNLSTDAPYLKDKSQMKPLEEVRIYRHRHYANRMRSVTYRLTARTIQRRIAFSRKWI